MQAFTILIRIVVRLTVSALALAGVALLIWTFVIWPDMRQTYPDLRAEVSRANSEAFAIPEGIVSGNLDCGDALEILNSLAALSSGEAHLTAIALDELEECGRIAGTSMDDALLYTRMNQRDLLSFDDRLSDYMRRLIRLSGLAGHSRFWRDYYAIIKCTEINHNDFDLENWRRYQAGDWSYHDIRTNQYQRAYDCGLRLEALGRAYLNHDDVNIRGRAAGLIERAGRYGNADARWWYEFVLPTLDTEYFGLPWAEAVTYRSSGPCGALMRNSTEADRYGRTLRELTAMGQTDATARWLSYGPFVSDQPFWTCTEAEYPDLFRHSQAWNGGYDTPFWYAVHAVRTGHDAGLSHLPEIEAEIGADCLALAREIAMGLRTILPGPPVDDPQLRQLILSSIRCQPEDLRDPPEYWNEHYTTWDRAGYLPPEAVYVLPSFEPVFRRVEE